MAVSTPAEVSTPVTINPVTSRSDYKRFINYQYDFYKDYPRFVAPLRAEVTKILNPKKNAFFEHGKIQPFIAENREGKIVGRIAAIVNGMHLEKYQDQTGFFGFFECIEDYSVAEQLFDTAGNWLKEQGLLHVRGPANPSLNETSGLLVGGFNREPSFMMPYNPSYYMDFLTQYGFTRAMTMWAYYIHYKYAKIDKLKRGVGLLMRRYPDLKLRTIDMKRFDEEARHILDIYNDAWGNNWGHVPMTNGEFAQMAKDLKQIIDPQVIYMLEEKGVPIGFSITLPNINLALKHVKNGRLFPTGLFQLLFRAKFGGIHDGRTLLMGVRQSHQGKGFDAILNLAIIEGGPKNGYYGSEMSWVLDNNKAMMNALIDFGGTYEKEYVMLEKML
ncbi:MAG: hypothetical protein AB8G77_18415 [Rhodothermales bacterium]